MYIIYLCSAILYIYILYIYIMRLTGGRRCIGCLISICHFPQKSPMVSGSFAKDDLHFKASYGSSPPSTGWRRPIGRLVLQVIFRKRAINYRALLREMTPRRRSIGCLISIRRFPQTTLWLLALENDLQLKVSYGSWPPCSSLKVLKTFFISIRCFQQTTLWLLALENDLQLKVSYGSWPPCGSLKALKTTFNNSRVRNCICVCVCVCEYFAFALCLRVDLYIYICINSYL